MCLLALLSWRNVSAFESNLTATPNPNSGNYTLTWNIHTNEGVYALLERPSDDPWAGWTVVSSTTYATTFYSANSRPVGSYDYRIRHNHQECPVGGGRRGGGGCSPTIDFSETITVLVEEEPVVPSNFKSEPLVIDGPTTVFHTNPSYWLTWNLSPGGAMYELEERLDASDFDENPDIGVWKQVYGGPQGSVNCNFKDGAVLPHSDGTFGDCGAITPSTFSYRVRACSASAVCSDWTPTLTVVIALYQPPITPPPFEDQLFSVASGDYNEDGYVDMLISGDYLDIIIGSRCVLGAGSGCIPTEHWYHYPPTNSELSHASWDYTTHEVLRFDFDTDGTNDLFLMPKAKGYPSFQIPFESIDDHYNGNLTVVDELNTIEWNQIGVDLGDPGTVAYFEDLNTDGFLDLRVEHLGIPSGIYYGTSPNGWIALPLGSDTESNDDDQLIELADTSTTIAVWNGFSAALNNGDADLASQYFAPSSRDSYAQLFTLLGSNISGLTSNWTELTLIELTDRVATYSLKQDEGGSERLHSIIFVRDPVEGWRIQSL